MTEIINLIANLRQAKVSNLKDELPGVIYGSGIDNINLVLKRFEFERVFKQSGESGLISLKLDNGQEYPVIVKDFQTDPIKHRIIHVDFYKVDMKQEVEAEVTLHFIGEAPAVKNHGGIVVEHMDSLKIKCLPSALVQKIEIDLAGLTEIGSAIHVKDIKLPDDVKAEYELDDIVVNVVEPRKVVEEAPVSEVPAEGAEVKAEEKVGEGVEKKEE
jgi:large subunit ribosomal protein L25